jgi:dTDP-4-dehydrorhamnose reductase
VIEALQPDLVLHLAACSRLADCERDPDAALRTNAWVAEQFAQRFGARLVLVSTDLVFDGRGAPYAETAAPAPLSVYGASKVHAEDRVFAHGGRVVRLPLLFGDDAHGRGATASLRRVLADGRHSPLFTNEYRTPLHADDAAHALVELVVDPDGPNLVHLPGPERVSRWQFARRLCDLHGLVPASLLPVECQDALRPRDVSLAGAWRAPRSLDAMLSGS